VQLGYPEKEVWLMTPYKIKALFEIHREFAGAATPTKETGIDDIFGGL